MSKFSILVALLITPIGSALATGGQGLLACRFQTVEASHFSTPTLHLFLGHQTQGWAFDRRMPQHLKNLVHSGQCAAETIQCLIVESPRGRIVSVVGVRNDIPGGVLLSADYPLTEAGRQGAQTELRVLQGLGICEAGGIDAVAGGRETSG